MLIWKKNRPHRPHRAQRHEHLIQARSRARVTYKKTHAERHQGHADRASGATLAGMRTTRWQQRTAPVHATRSVPRHLWLVRPADRWVDSHWETWIPPASADRSRNPTGREPGARRSPAIIDLRRHRAPTTPWWPAAPTRSKSGDDGSERSFGHPWAGVGSRGSVAAAPERLRRRGLRLPHRQLSDSAPSLAASGRGAGCRRVPSPGTYGSPTPDGARSALSPACSSDRRRERHRPPDTGRHVQSGRQRGFGRGGCPPPPGKQQARMAMSERQCARTAAAGEATRLDSRETDARGSVPSEALHCRGARRARPRQRVDASTCTSNGRPGIMSRGADTIRPGRGTTTDRAPATALGESHVAECLHPPGAARCGDEPRCRRDRHRDSQQLKGAAPGRRGGSWSRRRRRLENPVEHVAAGPKPSSLSSVMMRWTASHGYGLYVIRCDVGVPASTAWA